MALVYRAHFALIRNPITNSKGRNTSAIYGFANTLLHLIEGQKPTHLAVAFDTSAPTPRHQIFPEYKANRDAMPEELAEAIPIVKEMCRAWGIPVLEYDGYEADDVIGTLAKQAEKRGKIDTFMVTPDKDFAQLVDERTAMWKPGRQGSDHEILGLPEILEKWEIERPDQVIDILALWGDASDNIPGIPGIGEKTAKKLIKLYDSVEGLLANKDQLKGKQKENVTNFAEQGLLSKKLVTIDINAPVKESFDDLVRSEGDPDKLRELFEELEFRTLTKRLFGDTPSTSKTTTPEPVFESLKTLADVPHSYTEVTTKKQLTALQRTLATAEAWCFDVETTGLDRFQAKLLGIAVSAEPGTAYYIPAKFLEDFAPTFQKPNLKVGHNLKYDLHILKSHGVEVSGPFFDTMLAHQLLYPEQKHTMDYLAETLLGYSTIKLADLFQPAAEDDLFAAATKQKAKKGEINPADLDPSKLAEYAAEDADITLQLYQKLAPELTPAGQKEIFDTIEAPLLPVLVRMEAEGIAIDLDLLAETNRELEERLATLSQSIEEAAGREFNLNSPKQLGEVLFSELNLIENPKKTKTGQFRTDEQTLAALAPDHQIVADILAYREAAKLKSTYVDALPEHRAAHSGRVHTHLHQLVASTGRLASSDPNLQNIPIRTELGRGLRKAFVPRGPEFTLLAVDYSQIELRIMAALSADPAMVEAFVNGEDIHTATAAKVYDVAKSDVTPEMRRASKMVNFGIIYGISAFGLAQRLGIPREEASTIIKAYFKQYPAIKKFMDDTIAEAKEAGYAQTLSGRRRYFPDLNSRNQGLRANAERAAINLPVQGTAADMIKLAMIRIDELLQGKKTRMILQVHDELLFDLHQDEAADLVPQITKIMTTALPLPLGVIPEVETGQGGTWLEAH